MPSLEVIQATVSKLSNGPPLVAAVAGGTTGIGAYIAEALATAFADHGPRLRVYIVGRNATRADAVITQCQRISPGSEWRFVKATDLALISEVDRCCDEIMRHETEKPFHGGPVRIDLLYMTHCLPVFGKRTTTKEGLDAFISTTYYSRVRFIMQLLPLLTASPLPGHVISVYAGTFEDGTSPGELPIGCPPDATYGVRNVRKHAIFMKTFLFEEIAARYAGRLSLVHIYPGLVDGPGMYSPEMPLWFRALWRLLKPLAQLLYMTPPDVCGQVMLYLGTSRYPAKTQKPAEGIEVTRGTSGEPGGGSYTVGQRGDPQKGVSYAKVRKEDTGRQVWDHTMETLERIERANQTDGIR
ncbi:hypothetical protein LTR36_005517 [Oleoguttula mirabilis]|uniref:Uncharacterized protein n=1 Tax=Oleoguttula mirabilis TaxID=1507867 RepID=A0AAV9JF38_9PEZI|nr:hypothetical protein LTR36_005517 [Oleoguttula mirabilis]